jgi:hypothetical protein
LVSNVKATPITFENVLLQHICPPVHGPNAPVRIGNIDERYASHNLSPPSAFLVRKPLTLQANHRPPFMLFSVSPLSPCRQRPSTTPCGPIRPPMPLLPLSIQNLVLPSSALRPIRLLLLPPSKSSHLLKLGGPIPPLGGP